MKVLFSKWSRGSIKEKHISRHYVYMWGMRTHLTQDICQTQAPLPPAMVNLWTIYHCITNRPQALCLKNSLYYLSEFLQARNRGELLVLGITSGTALRSHRPGNFWRPKWNRKIYPQGIPPMSRKFTQLEDHVSVVKTLSLNRLVSLEMGGSFPQREMAAGVCSDCICGLRPCPLCHRASVYKTALWWLIFTVTFTGFGMT